MAKTQVTSEPTKAPVSPPVTEPLGKLPEAKAESRPNLPMTRGGFEITNMEQAWRFATALSDSSIVPDSYKKKPTDCLVALDLASRLDAPWLAVMQHVYAVHGRPAMDSALCTALVNRSGMFLDPLDYEVVGDDASKPNYKVRAYATRRTTGKVLYGPWITWELISAEKWDSKDGSKWRTMPEQMFHFRAASWFQRRHCPELTMGMMTLEEAEEVPAKHIESTVVEPGVAGVKKLLADRAQQNGSGATQPQGAEPQGEAPPETQKQPQVQEQPEPAEPVEQDEQTAAKVAEQKERLQGTGAGAPIGTGAQTGGNGGKKKSNLF